MAKDVGTVIRKSIVVSFLPCLVVFFRIPSLHGSSFFFVTCFCRFFLGGGGGETLLAEMCCRKS